MVGTKPRGSEAVFPIQTEAEAVEFRYKTEEQVRETVLSVPLIGMPGLEIGISPGNTTSNSALVRDAARVIQGKKAAESGRRPIKDQAVRMNNYVVARESFHYLRVIANHDQRINIPEFGPYERTVACHERLLNKHPYFRDEVNSAIERVTEEQETGDEGTAKN